MQFLRNHPSHAFEVEEHIFGCNSYGEDPELGEIHVPSSILRRVEVMMFAVDLDA